MTPSTSPSKRANGPTSTPNTRFPTWLPPPESLPLWQRFTAPESSDIETIQRSFCRHVTKTLARTAPNLDNFAAYQSLAYGLRDRLIDKWNITQQHHTKMDPKRVYYLSLEFLLGRSLDNALLNLDVKGLYRDALKQLGFRIEDLIEEEVDAALGNGGLGRLAACFMDSLATMDYAAWGYGIRYTYGIFQQRIVDGYQTEFPDYWLNFGNPWEIERLDVTYEVRFRGYVTKIIEDSNDQEGRYAWEGGEKIIAVAYDVPIPGYDTKNCINIRLWSSKPKKEFDFASFNEGNYEKAVEEQKSAENVSSVLYPNDNHMVGKILRLKQHYFFVSATLSDILRRFKKTGRPWTDLPDQVSIQLNDTHPTLGIVELQRILVDEEGLHWDDAWEIVVQTYSFTNHTVLPEAMEKWAVPLIAEVLPRHMMIIFDINLFFLQKVEKMFPHDRDRLGRMSIIEEGHPQYVRMSYLAVVGSHAVNGVASLHSSLLKNVIFKDFVDFYGLQKFTNVTNGVTPRRWLFQCNPSLSALIAEKLGSKAFLKDLSLLSNLKHLANDKDFQERFMAVKYLNKMRLSDYVRSQCGVQIPPEFLFDCHVKRFQEYKRQFMNILGVVYRYHRLKSMTKADRAKEVPHACIFSGKSAPGYFIAKLVIKLVNSVAEVVNNDPDVADVLKIVFIPNYNVSLAEIIIPASDISQHISTAGTEASGTSNMKFVLNGGIILGTIDGANIEIGDEVGSENIFFFGKKADQVEDVRHGNRYRRMDMDPKLRVVVDLIDHGTFGDPKTFEPLISTLTIGGDYYIVNADFDSYINTQAVIDTAFRDKEGWARKVITAAFSMGKFSSDRSIQEYANRIWKIERSSVPSY